MLLWSDLVICWYCYNLMLFIFCYDLVLCIYCYDLVLSIYCYDLVLSIYCYDLVLYICWIDLVLCICCFDPVLCICFYDLVLSRYNINHLIRNLLMLAHFTVLLKIHLIYFVSLIYTLQSYWIYVSLQANTCSYITIKA